MQKQPVRSVRLKISVLTVGHCLSLVTVGHWTVSPAVPRLQMPLEEAVRRWAFDEVLKYKAVLSFFTKLLHP